MTKLTDYLAEQVLNSFIENGDIDICESYGERGYSKEDGQKSIVLGDWNNFDKYPNFMEWLEANYAIEWEDEWLIDYNTSKCYRTVADSYGWEQQFRFTDCGELLTPDDPVSEWIEHSKMEECTPTPHVLPSFIEHEDIEAEGFELIDEDLENGWYNRHDDPNDIAERLFEDGYREVVFSLNGVSQFAISFSVYARK